jgi:hypothetical protein
MDVDVLRKIKRVITHESSPGTLCPDGVASALIVLDALPRVEVEFVGYNSLRHRELTANAWGGQIGREEVLFVDFTPWVECAPDGRMTDRGLAQARVWVEAGAVVLDHHEGVADLVALFGDRGVYAAEPGVSGAGLAFQEVWTPLDRGDQGDRDLVRQFAALAGVRDTWQQADPRWREACTQAAALSFWPWATWREAAGDGLFHRETAYLRKRLFDVGEVLLQRQAAADAQNAAEARRFDVDCTPEDSSRASYEGRRVRAACFEGGSREASDFPARNEVDLVLAWHCLVRDGRPAMKVSARSSGGFDCAALARAHGGNGHRGAAGFTVALGGEDPYALVERVVREHLHARLWRAEP